MVKLSHQINRLEDGKRQRGTKSIAVVWKSSATPRRPFFQRGNPPRPLASHFFSVEILRDPSQAIFSAWKSSATPRGPFFQCGNPPRPLAGHFFSVEVLRDPSPAIFSAWKSFATPRDPFFQCGSPSRPLAGHFFSVGMLRDPSRNPSDRQNPLRFAPKRPITNNKR